MTHTKQAPVAGENAPRPKGGAEEAERLGPGSMDVVLAETNKTGRRLGLRSRQLARNCLITAGRHLRTRSRTSLSQVADTFHMFMLSLYESLRQAANPATTRPRHRSRSTAGQAAPGEESEPLRGSLERSGQLARATTV